MPPSDKPSGPIEPRITAAAIEEAKGLPGGWLYCIGGGLDPNGAVPPQAIVGAWKVALDGTIEPGFTHNPNYNRVLYPPSTE